LARKILLADDSVTAQNMGRKILSDAGYEVITVNNGSAALKRVTEQKPELIVLDVYMPGYSGLEVCQRLKESRETSRIPVLLTVGKLEPFKPEDARRVGADAFIVKPFEASELLSALTRLEDRIVPQGDGSRFASTVSGLEHFAGDPTVKKQESADGGEQGWKSRIRFPSKKSKKEEPEPEPDYVAPPAFRDLREPTQKVTSAAPAETPAPRQEPGLVPDLPRDITPDELDALSALVAKLDGPIPQAEEITPISDKIGFSGTEAEPKGEVAAGSKTDEVAPVTPRVETPAPKEEKAQPVDVASETKEEVAAANPAPPQGQSPIAESATTEIKTTPSIDDYTSAPVDRDDEPIFATVASAVPQSGKEEETSAQSESANAGLATAEVPASAAEDQQPPLEARTSGKEQLGVEGIGAEAAAEQVVANQPAAGEDRAPSEEELAEALRLLTPVQDSPSGQAQAAAWQPESVSVPASSMDAEAAKFYAGNGSRWVAEVVQLTPEEMSLSLEAEMFRTLAPAAVAATAATSFAMDQPVIDQPGTLAVEAAATRQAAQVEVATTVLAGGAVIQDSAETMDQPTRSVGAEQPTPEPVSGPSSVAESPDGTAAQSSIDAIVHEHMDATIAALTTTEEATGDQEAMSKKAKTDQGKASRSGWHQIHASANADAAKPSDGEVATEEHRKAMAAAANGDDGTSSGAPDSTAIASIVDSVLADLRPRIVEEIAKKLGRK
jgi:twitching motility two-component system response regulator PilH